MHGGEYFFVVDVLVHVTASEYIDGAAMLT